MASTVNFKRLARLAGGGALACGLLCALAWGAARLLPAPALLDGVPVARVIVDREGRPLRLGLASDQMYRFRVPLAAVSPALVEATLAYEDRYYYSHPGVNPFALARAAFAWIAGGRRTGASTITMQVARLRLGLPAGTWTGKLAQAWTALRLEAHYTKDEILEAYFTLAPYGGNIVGAEAASRIYFHTAASRLTPAEAAALAVVPQNPARRNPLRGPGFDEARKRLMARTAPEVPSDIPLKVHGPGDIPFHAPHACAELLAAPAPAMADGARDPQQGAPGGTRAVAAEDGSRGSLVTSSLSLPEQQLVEAMLKRYAARGKAWGISNAAAMLVHAPSLEILALAGSADFGDAAISGQVDGTRALRSPGSTLKPFIYGLALDQGLIHPMTLMIDSPRSFGGYDPENFDKGYRGPLPAGEALRTSRNLPAVALAEQLREPDLWEFLQRAGLKLPFGREHYGLALVLGG
ncbi:MAG: transglycosylase domain-containing protein, partial [Duodenibacillus sp.]|nr:transglycosylase domain-containing protein [Duodenibacillus sp.]